MQKRVMPSPAYQLRAFFEEKDQLVHYQLRMRILIWAHRLWDSEKWALPEPAAHTRNYREELVYLIAFCYDALELLGELYLDRIISSEFKSDLYIGVHCLQDPTNILYYPGSDHLLPYIHLVQDAIKLAHLGPGGLDWLLKTHEEEEGVRRVEQEYYQYPEQLHTETAKFLVIKEKLFGPFGRYLIGRALNRIKR